MGGWAVLCGLFSGLTWGILPSYWTKEDQYELEVTTPVCHYSVPFKVLKRQWLLFILADLFPVPGWGCWRGHEDDVYEGRVKVYKEVLAACLKQGDYDLYVRKSLVFPTATRRKILEEHYKHDKVLRDYALQYDPEVWDQLQQYRAKLRIAHQRLVSEWGELETTCAPLKQPEFIRKVDRYRAMEKDYISFWKKLVDDYKMALGDDL